MYTPNNDAIYLAAFGGAIAGLGAPNQPIQSVANAAEAADAFAQAVDTVWGVGSYTNLERNSLREACETVWATRSTLAQPYTYDPSAYQPLAQEIVALIRSGNAQVVAEGVNPNNDTGGGGGGVTAVTASLPLSSSGGPTPNITIADATPYTDGAMSASDKAKLNGLSAALAPLPVELSFVAAVQDTGSVIYTRA